ncbi:MAG: glycosyl transferase, partial [Rhodospirillales bacterium]|nr:glycosyl transferase [Rhodospirillales bacterium]
MTAAQLVAVLIVVAVATCGLTGVVVRQLRRWSILDHPNVRSSHSAPTPRGGGLAVVTVLMAAWALFAFTRDSAPMDMAWLIVLAIFLAVVSWFDDLKGLSVLLRLTAQIGAVTVFMAVVPAADPYFLGLLPPVFDRLVAGCLWLWFVNLFNFMDGIDGMAAGETASIGIGIVLVAALAGLDDHDGSMGFAGMTLAAAALG